MDLHVCHGSVLVLQATFKRAFSATKQRHLPETRATESKCAMEKEDLKLNITTIHFGFRNHVANFFHQLGGQHFIRVK